MTEILSPRITRQGAVCLISRRGTTRKARIEQSELDGGFQPYHPPSQVLEEGGGGLRFILRHGVHIQDHGDEHVHHDHQHAHLERPRSSQ